MLNDVVRDPHNVTLSSSSLEIDEHKTNNMDVRLLKVKVNVQYDHRGLTLSL